MSSNDVDVLWAELSFKEEGDFGLLLETLKKSLPAEDPALPVKEWNVLSTTDLGDGKILEVRVSETISTSHPEEEEVVDQVAELLNELLPGNLRAMAGHYRTLTIEGGDSMGWLDAEALGDLLSILAPFLDEGSEIQLSETVHNIWRFVVKDGKIAEQVGRITFDD